MRKLHTPGHRLRVRLESPCGHLPTPLATVNPSATVSRNSRGGQGLNVLSPTRKPNGVTRTLCSPGYTSHRRQLQPNSRLTSAAFMGVYEPGCECQRKGVLWCERV